MKNVKREPRGIRNNNPLNIVQTKDKWQGRAEARRRQQQATVNPYIWRDFEHFPTAWIARDEDGSLWLYDKEPREGGGMFHMSACGETMMSLPPESYPEVTYELSPVKVKLLFFAV